MRHVIAGLDPVAYRPHALHDAERRWPETNCYVDLLIEAMHATGRDPVAILGFTVAQDFEGDQFTFFKFPTADLQAIAGLDVQELAIFDDLEGHVALQVERGRLPMVEVDAFFLPDTRGISYRIAHSKTTIGINAIDKDARRMEYFHNAGYFALEGADYAAVLQKGMSAEAHGLPLFPYAEFVKFEAQAEDRVAAARGRLAYHLGRRPAQNPVVAYSAAFEEHARDLVERAPEYFHTYAFNTLRQLGANFELLSSHLDWLGAHGETSLSAASEAALMIAAGAKTMQFKLARAMARRRYDGLAEMLFPMAEAYEVVIGDLLRWADGVPVRAAA